MEAEAAIGMVWFVLSLYVLAMGGLIVWFVWWSEPS